MFKIGDVVRLKSGGPSMTVSYVEELGSISVYNTVWFDSSLHYQAGGFYKDMLEKVE